MTTKQISESVGKDPATVARWIESVSCKMQEVSRKVQEAKATKKPADYTLAEVCQIIEEGMGKAAADVYRTNAASAEMQKPQKTKYSASYIREVRLSLGKEAAQLVYAVLGSGLKKVAREERDRSDTPELFK